MKVFVFCNRGYKWNAYGITQMGIFSFFDWFFWWYFIHIFFDDFPNLQHLCTHIIEPLVVWSRIDLNLDLLLSTCLNMHITLFNINSTSYLSTQHSSNSMCEGRGSAVKVRGGYDCCSCLEGFLARSVTKYLQRARNIVTQIPSLSDRVIPQTSYVWL